MDFEAMLFDGGHSTQLYVKAGDLDLSIKGDPAPAFLYGTKKD